MKTLWRALTRGGFGATSARLVSIVCCLGALALLWLNVRRVHTDQKPIEIGLVLIGVSLASGQLQSALQDKSLPDHEPSPFRLALWLHLMITAVVTLLAVAVALLLLPEASAGAMRGHQRLADDLVLAQAVINGGALFVALLWNSLRAIGNLKRR